MAERREPDRPGWVAPAEAIAQRLGLPTRRPDDGGPDSTTGSPAPGVRASDAEREHAMDRLREAAGEGRLTFEELSDRIQAAGTATTREELAELLRDLPAEHERGVSPPVRPLATGGADRGLATIERRSSVFGDVRQAGAWRLPERSRWSTVFGDVDLDLREAAVSHDRLHVDAGSVFGDVTLLVPEGVVVDVRVRTAFGVVRQEAGLSGPPGAPVVVLTGGTWFGDVRVRSGRLRERLAALFRGRR